MGHLPEVNQDLTNMLNKWTGSTSVESQSSIIIMRLNLSLDLWVRLRSNCLGTGMESCLFLMREHAIIRSVI